MSAIDGSDPPDEIDFGEPHEAIAQRVLERAQGRRKPFTKLNFPEFATALAEVRARYIADSLSLDEDESTWAIRNELNHLSAALKRLHTNLVNYDKRKVPGWLSLQAAAERVDEHQEEHVEELKSKIALERRRRQESNSDPDRHRISANDIKALEEQLIITEQDRIFFETHKFSGAYFLLERTSRLMHLWTEEALKAVAASQAEVAREKVVLPQSKQESFFAEFSPEHQLILNRLPDLYSQFFRRKGIGTSQYLNDEGQPSSPFVDFVMAVLTEFDVKSSRNERFSRHTVANLLKKHRRTTRVIAASK